MDNKHNLQSYREAKMIGPHISAILKVINLSIRSLQHFKSYLPVIKIIKVMEEQKTLLELHKKKYDEVLDRKGQF
jgi:coproporphyrinogen III oxidase-like Fe-S oxidoreductase